MNDEQKAPYEQLSVVELHAELRRLKENLADLEETHAFTFGRTTVHIGAEQAQSMQEEHENECGECRALIMMIEELLKGKG